MAASNALVRWSPTPFSAVVWASILFAEALLIWTYVTVANAQLMAFHVYPFVWINLSIWAVWRTDPPAASGRKRTAAGAIAAAYFLVLAYFGGLVGRGHRFMGHEVTPAFADFAYGLEVATAVPPGYGPALVYSGPYLVSTVSPYLLIGFIALAYLLYVTILDATGEASVGLVGVFSCVGCSFPLIVAFVSGAGTTTALTATLYSQAYALSTLAFVFTLGVLYWRPFEAANARQTLLTLAGALVLVTATVHLALGAAGLLEALRSGLEGAALSLAFVAFALAAYLVVGGFATGYLARQYAMALAGGLTFLALAFYVDWHFLGYTESLLPLEYLGLEHSHDHGDHGHHDHSPALIEQLGEAFREDSAALVAKSAEFLALLFVLAVGLQEWVDSYVA
ncbi:DUF7546 family protein [Natronobiforma cellulositropha]|uniref:DUF7546 family protein n=1 Tax=Natronobiforma cellulositropha TaxID=1679076 RepID=UPI0021D56B91|nr:hypothetical protein [Natronobiforma cellulositropha]